MEDREPGEHDDEQPHRDQQRRHGRVRPEERWRRRFNPAAGMGSIGVTVTKFLQLLRILELYLE